MTPENVLKASELIEKLKSLRRVLAELKTAAWIQIETSAGSSWSTGKLDELFQEVQNLLYEQSLGDIDRMERELRALGVDLPALDFVNLPDSEEAATRPADPSSAH